MVLYECAHCQFITKSKASYNKHVQTKKHEKMLKLFKSSPSNQPKEEEDEEIESPDKLENVNSHTEESPSTSTIHSIVETFFNERFEIKLDDTNTQMNKKFKNVKNYILHLEERIQDLEDYQEEQYKFNRKIINMVKGINKIITENDMYNDNETREIIIRNL